MLRTHKIKYGTNHEPKWISWPFRKMKISQTIKIDDKTIWRKAVTAAHITGQQKGWKFQSYWYASHGLIKRIE